MSLFVRGDIVQHEDLLYVGKVIMDGPPGSRDVIVEVTISSGIEGIQVGQEVVAKVKCFTLIRSAFIPSKKLTLKLELEQEEDGRWLASAPDYPGVMRYGDDEHEALKAVVDLVLNVIRATDKT